MTIKGLKIALKKANRRVDKAFARYKKALMPLYLQINDKSAPRYVSAYQNSVIHEQVVNFATDCSWTFYRRGRGGKFYEKSRYIGREWDAYNRAYQPVGQDYLDLCKLEAAIDASIDEREKIIDELESLGINPYSSDFWSNPA